MAKETKLSKILNLLNENPDFGYRAYYLAEHAGVSKNTIHPLLVDSVNKGQVEKIVVTKKEVYYIKPV